MKHTTSIPVYKNQDLELYIESLGSEGQGIAKVDGFCVFVERALPSETVMAHIIKVASNYAVAKLTEVLSPSPERVEPDCPWFAQCGGCALRHLSYSAQLNLKRQTVTDALKHIGGIEYNVNPVLGMTEPDHYRNKGSFPFRDSGNGPAFGLFAARSHRLIPVDDCIIEDERIMKAVASVSRWALLNKVSGYSEDTKKGVLRHVVVRVTTTGQLMVVIVTTGPLPKKAALIAELSDCDSIWHNINEKDTNVIFGERFDLIHGCDSLSEEILGKRFSVSPRSFLQVNPLQTVVLYSTALDLLSPQKNETLFDIYCGIGTISLIASDSVKKVIGIEAVPDAIDDAIKNASANNVDNAEFICGNAEDILPSFHEQADAIVIDPPRKGCDEAVLKAIVDGSAKRVAYVSCNPATLARDLKFLVSGGMMIQNVQPVDMFPGTCHVETVVLLSRI